jgi:CHASE3 domain sensor protein
MNIGFFIIGAVIFSVYIGLTFWNIFYSNQKQREENYPNLKKNRVADANAPSKGDSAKADNETTE